MNAAMVMDDTVINAQTTMAGVGPHFTPYSHMEPAQWCACTSVIRLRPIILPANTVPG